MAVEKGMGLKKGEKIKQLGLIEIVSVRAEPLAAMIDDIQYGHEELRREGFPFGHDDPVDFVHDIARHYNKPIQAYINRIEFKRIWWKTFVNALLYNTLMVGIMGLDAAYNRI